MADNSFGNLSETALSQSTRDARPKAARDAAIKRANKAERALAAPEAKVGKMGSDAQSIQRLREAVRLKYRKRQLDLAMKRIKVLEAANERLRNLTQAKPSSGPA